MRLMLPGFVLYAMVFVLWSEGDWFWAIDHLSGNYSSCAMFGMQR